MTKIIMTLACLTTLFLSGCAGQSKLQQPEYSGVGGMAQWDIQPEVYLYHYENGFTGIDALGYDEQLQTVWARLGAAVTCGIDFDKQTMIRLLVQQFGDKAITHELNGIGFHSVQSRKVPNFCTDSRVKEISRAIKRYNRGRFD